MPSIDTLTNAVGKALPELKAFNQREQWRKDPERWAKEVTKAFLWSKQREIALSVRDNPRTAVRSSNNAGKTMIAGLIGAWFIATNDPHDTIVVCTAPAFAQIKTNLFYEFGKNIRLARENNADLPGYITVGQNIAEWKLSDGTQLAIGRRPPDKDAATSFIGIHRANVLVILDEAGGTPPELFNLAERITTTGNARILAIGNPDRLGSEFHKMFKDGSDWTQIHINGLETPNFTKDRVAPYPVLREYMESNNFPYSTEEFPDDLRQYMLQPKWVDRQLRVLPPGDARWKIWILGEFPDTDDMVFFPESVINRALEADIEDDSDIPLILGVDLARFGCFDDQTELLTSEGWKPFEQVTGREQVLSLNPDTLVSEWAPITKVHKYPFEGELNVYERRSANFAVTDNHNFYSAPGIGNNWKIRRFDQLPQEFRIAGMNTWKGHHESTTSFTTIVPQYHGGERRHDLSFDSLDWAKFLGWFVSEGNVYTEKRKNGRNRILIAQNPGRKADEIAELLTRMGIKYSYKKYPHGPCGQFEFTSRSVGDWLIDNCGVGASNKRIPESIKEATPAIIDAFLTAFVSGDGTIGAMGQRTYITSSRKLADDIQEVLFKVGRAGKISPANIAGSTFEIDGRTITRLHDTYHIYERRTPTHKRIDKRNVKKVPYSGFVYCVSTPYKTIAVRRRGVPMWSGNSDSSVIYTNRGGRIRKHSEWSKTNAVESANRVHQAATELGAKYVNIDASGLGGPIIDNILTMGGKYSVVQMNGAGSSPDPRRWLNARAWWYDGLREKMTAGEIDMDLDDKELLDEARDINAEFTDRGAIKVEGKKDLKARTGGSPDHLDATVYASYNPEDNVSTPKKERQYQDPSDIIGDIPNYLRLMTDWA